MSNEPDKIIYSMIRVSKRHGQREVLKDISLSYFYGAKIGVLGLNGAGKSSLLKILAGVDQAFEGKTVLAPGYSLGYLEQEPLAGETRTVRAVVEEGAADLVAIAREFEEINARFAEPMEPEEMDALIARQAQVQELMDAKNVWDLDSRLEMAMDALRCPPGDMPVDRISGGERRRVALCRLLLQNPDILLLDEPTNHLDLDSIEWLEGLLKEFKGSIVLITHDRSFLDNVATRIVELDRGQLNSYPGNFAAYVTNKAEQLAQEAVINAKADKLLAQEEVWIRKGVEARRTRATARIVRLQELRAEHAARRTAQGSVKMDVSSGEKSGKLVSELTHVSKTFGDRVIVDDFSATILRGDKIGLLGANGAGKTTLLKLILGQLQPDPAPANAPAPEPGESPWGTVRQGTNITVAYFDQMRNALDLDATLEDFISPGSEWIEIGNQRKHVKSYLGDFLFSPARANSPVRSLSGGERNRLLLARLFARPTNVLVLDEPTNDLDIDTLELLEDLLQNYDGTVFLVSHDRTFLDNVVTSTIASEGNGQWREYEGGVQDWLVQSKRSKAAAEQAAKAGASKTTSVKDAAASAPAAAASAAPVAKRKLSYKEQRELEQLPAQIAALEAEQAEIQKALADGSLYATDNARAVQLQLRDGEIEEALMTALERWELLSA